MGYLHTVIHRVLSSGRFHSLKETETMSGRSKSFCRALFLQRDIAVSASFCNFTLRFIVSLSMNYSFLYNSFLFLYNVRYRVVVSSVFLFSSDETQFLFRSNNKCSSNFIVYHSFCYFPAFSTIIYNMYKDTLIYFTKIKIRRKIRFHYLNDIVRNLDFPALNFIK